VLFGFLAGKYGIINPEKSKEHIYLAMFLEFLGLLGCVCYVLILTILIYDPRGAVFLGDLIPQKYFYFPVKLLVIFFHAYILLSIHTGSVAVGTATAIYSFYFAPILIRELRIGKSRNFYKMSAKLRRPKNIRHVYRSLQIIQANIFSFLGRFLFMCHGNFLVSTLFLNFVLIRYWGQLQIVTKIQFLIWTYVLMTFWACVLELGRFLLTKGNKTLRSWKGGKWKSATNNNLMKKFLRSCKPIVLSYGKQFVVGRVSVLAFFRGNMRGTCRALLTTKK